jgi:hypothetical protein
VVGVNQKPFAGPLPWLQVGKTVVTEELGK